MSFTQNIKAQLSKIENTCDFCDIAELSSVVKVCTSYRDGQVTVTTENEDVAERIRELFEKVFSRPIDYINRNGSFRFCPDIEFFTDCMALRLMLFNTGDAEITPLECCKAAYIRGAFLGCGSMPDPKKRYHLEFDAKHESYAHQIQVTLNELGIASKITCRKGRYVVYVKEYEAIADILGCMGAVGAAMELYNVSIEKEIRNAANRQANCEIANIDKITNAAFQQIECIKKIEKTIGFDELPNTLSEIAKVRLRYPDESLKELGEHLNPPIGKSGVNHRLKRIMEIAAEL